ncbi:MAG: hypothetical protein MJ072_01370 [Clostridia bacterium]|nr:hypothetical protein [Clostridia bacterium]
MDEKILQEKNKKNFDLRDVDVSVVDMEKLVRKYSSKLMLEAWVNSAICGIVTGLFVMLLTSLVLYFTPVKMFWIAIIAWGVTAIASTPVFFKKIFNPSARRIASRIDACGLEERVLTAVQLKDDYSYIATRQREDAVKAFSEVNLSLIKFLVPLQLVIVLCCAFVSGVGMTVVNALADNSVVKKGSEIIEEIVTDPPVFYEVCYEVEGEGGMIVGDEVQVVEEGKNCSEVYAEPFDGYMFESWSDGNEDPYRLDANITKDMVDTDGRLVITVRFSPEPTAGFMPSNDPGDSDMQMPGPQGEPSEEGEDGDDDNNQSNPHGAGGKWEERDQVLDGQTAYGDVYDIFYEETAADVSQSGELSDFEKSLIDKYFKIREKYKK